MPRLAAGDKMPNFEFNTGYRTGVTLRGEWKGKIVLWVLRYIGCTVCRYDCKLIADRYDEFMKKDTKVFVLMQSDQEHIQNDMKNTNAWLPNGDCVVGTAIFCSTDGEDLASLSDEQMALFRGWPE